MAVLLVLAAPAPASADQISDAQACSAMTDSLMRLTCFDRIFPKKEAAETAPASPRAPSNVWEITREKAAIDDSPKIVAILLPRDPAGSYLGSFALAARCIENTTSVLITPGEMVVADVKVTTRLDDKPAQIGVWQKSDNFRAIGLWNGSKSIPFLKELAQGQTLFVRVEDGSRKDVIFDLANIGEVASEISAACNWK